MPLRSFVRRTFAGGAASRSASAVTRLRSSSGRSITAGRARRAPEAASRAAPHAVRCGAGVRSAGLRPRGAGAPPRSRRWREAGCGSARLSPGSAGSLDACTEPWRARTGRAAPDRVRGAARTSRAGSWRPRCGLAGRSGPRRSGICARNVPAARVGDRPVGCKVRSLDRIITGEVARLVGFYEKATGVRASRANEDFAELGPLRRDPRAPRRRYDSQKTRDELAARGMAGQIAHNGDKAPLQAGQRWHVERGRTPGTTASTGCSAATNAAKTSSTRSSTSPTRSSPSVP